MRKLKVQVERVGNENCHRYHTNFNMSPSTVGRMLGGEMFESEKEDLNRAPEEAKRLAIGIQGIEGVLTFSFEGYQLQIVKAPLFDWEEIDPQVILFIQMIWQEALQQSVEHIPEVIWDEEKWRQMAHSFEDAYDFED